MNNGKRTTDKEKGKVKPDDGQGSEGNFGSDGDWGNPKEKNKGDKASSPVPVKRD